MQQAFWNSHDGQQKSDNPSLNQWVDEMDSWWKSQATDVPASVSALYEKLRFSSQFFVNFAEPFINTNKASDPSSVLVKYLEVFLEAIDKEGDFDNDIKGFWKLPSDMWLQQINALGGFPNSFLELVKSSIKDESLNPEFTQAGHRYLQSLKRYQSEFVEMTIQAASVLTDELHKEQQHKEQQTQQASCRDVCSTWVDIFDSHYADFVRSSQYPPLYADVINSWMLLIQQSEQLLTPWLKAVNMPIREDIDHLITRQKELLDENQALKKELDSLKDAG